eukprot:m51a1_g6637 hypothetical protein (360) ;mRNA; r:104672-105949
MAQPAAAKAQQSAVQTVRADPTKCADCGKPFGLFNKRYQCEAPGCRKALCSQCSDWPILPGGATGAAQLIETCEACFRRLSSLDRSRSYDEAGPLEPPAPGGPQPALLFLHGGGACRRMWGPHVALLSREFRCCALDLPGHGALSDAPLTLQSATAAVVDFEHLGGQRVVLVGSSLGGYLACHLVGEHPGMFAGAVVCAAGQNVGPGRSVAASLGLVFLGAVAAVCRNKTLVSALVRQAPHVPGDVLDGLLHAGYYLKQSEQQVEVLKAIAPEEQLRKYGGSVLFINGGLDHRDSELRWLRAAANGRLVTYEDVDHFFTHDSRSFARFVDDVRAFALSVARADAPDPSEPGSLEPTAAT